MSGLVIEGGSPLCGVVNIQGAKNSVLPILAASILSDGECCITNCPDISDRDTAAEILRNLGCKIFLENNISRIDPKNISEYEIPDRLMRRMRSSIIFLGALLSETGRARISLPGGCDIGNRPVDIHFSALQRMGAKITESHGYMECEAKRLTGARINLPFPSVGATENIMLAASKAEGITIIENAAKEPEITDLQNYINSMGGKIKGAGSATVVIEGVRSLHGTEYAVIPDRIVASTYMCAVAATRGNALFKCVKPEHLRGVTDVLRDAGCTVDEYPQSVSIECDGLRRLRSSDVVRSMPYPGFPTDAGSPFVAMMSVADGTTVFVETIFENRYKYVGELRRMGAKIRTEGSVAIIEGVKKLYGTSVEAHDLRGGAALVVAAVAAEGQSEICNAEYIKRGYEKIDTDLAELGAKISFA